MQVSNSDSSSPYEAVPDYKDRKPPKKTWLGTVRDGLVIGTALATPYSVVETTIKTLNDGKDTSLAEIASMEAESFANVGQYAFPVGLLMASERNRRFKDDDEQTTVA